MLFWMTLITKAPPPRSKLLPDDLYLSSFHLNNNDYTAWHWVYKMYLYWNIPELSITFMFAGCGGRKFIKACNILGLNLGSMWWIRWSTWKSAKFLEPVLCPLYTIEQEDYLAETSDCQQDIFNLWNIDELWIWNVIWSQIEHKTCFKIIDEILEDKKPSEFEINNLTLLMTQSFTPEVWSVR